MGIVYSAVRTAARSSAYRDKVAAERKSAVVEWSRQQHAALDAKRQEVAVRNPRNMPSPAEVLSAIRDSWLARYVGAEDAALDLITLWAAHTWYREPASGGGLGRLSFRATPRLFLLSDEPGSGKTLVLQLLSEICANTFGVDEEPTEYGLVSALADENATVLLDEGDILFGRGSRKEGVRAVVNAGYSGQATKKTGRNGGTRKCVFGPIALAALSRMATATDGTLSATFSRAICVEMKRGRPAEDPDTRSESDGEVARKALAWLAGVTREKVLAMACSPALDLAGLEGRSAQIWRPLFAVADVVGGDWPARARRAAATFSMGGGGASGDEEADLAASFRTAFMG